MQTQNPDISVVIVNWNTRQYLLDCIESLQDTTRRAKLEIIVVDNGSEDRSEDAIRGRYPDVVLVQNGANYGFARANNIGFSRALGRYLCLVNTDVIALDGVMDSLMDQMDAEPDIGLMGPKTITREGKLRHNCRRFPTLRNAAADYLLLNRLFPSVTALEGRTLGAATYDSIHDAEVLSGCFLMVRREAFAEVGPLDEAFFFYGEDTDWCRRFHDHGWRIVYKADAQAIHFGGGSTSAYPTKYYLTMEKADLQYWRKHHRPSEVARYRLIKIVYHGVGVLAWSPVYLLRRDQRSNLKLRGHSASLAWLVTGRSLA
ncbi:MAG TPA: glycosyltransferase family 2 protein [Actinomycetota bacterium]|nr:glycosyltransferase family 2 protein [Actinomycetota bacterium]